MDRKAGLEGLAVEKLKSVILDGVLDVRQEISRHFRDGFYVDPDIHILEAGQRNDRQPPVLHLTSCHLVCKPCGRLE